MDAKEVVKKLQEDPFMNSMVAPCGKVGYVKVSTGPLAKDLEPAIVPIETAIAMAKACADNDFNLEPTGGIDLSNFKEILSIAINAGVKRVVPHVYSSIIDKETGATKVEDVKVLYNIIKDIVE